ncbi:MAG: tyrosine--tRNA ligase [Bacteroidota bacterium]
MMNVIEELWWRGMIHEIIPGTDSYLAENKISLYLGVDPTSDSMHIGNLVTVMMLVNFQKHGHTPVALVGGATGRVGDPSGKDKERQLLDEETLERNVMGIRKQLESFLDFEAQENPARMINNYEWFQGMGFLEFLRDVGKHVTISYMMNKESVKKRLKSESGLSYTEFAYQLLQGYDFYHLYKEHGVKMQIGGSDQWGNITTGTELIRRMLGSEEKAYAAVCPLLTREDGSKFGKSADGKSIWLDPERTSPYEFYQYWMQAADADAEKYIKIFTLKGKEEVEGLIAQHQEAPHKRALQKALAEDVTGRVHGTEGLEQAEKLTEFLFGRNTSPESLQGLSKKEWTEIAKVSDTKKLSKGEMDGGMGVLDFLVSIGVAKSKGEARRAIEKDKSIKINLQACKAPDQQLSLADTFHGGFIHVQKGKKNKYIVQVD